MASTFTTNIRLEKQGDGENPNAWGTILNSNVIDLVDQAVAAYQIVSVSGTTPLTLTQVNGLQINHVKLSCLLMVHLPQKLLLLFLLLIRCIM